MSFGNRPDDTLAAFFNRKPMDQLNFHTIPLDMIEPWPDNPYKPYSEEKMQELTESIREHGLMNPIIVRMLQGGRYQALAGMNRIEASRRAGKHDIVARVLETISEDEAIIIVNETNLQQRDTILPSERGKSYRQLIEALKRQGKRNDLVDAAERFNARDYVAASVNVSGASVHRYIRLTYLMEPILEKVDSGDLPLRVAAALSYLDHEWQQVIFEYISEKAIKISESQAAELRYAHEAGTISKAEIERVLVPSAMAGLARPRVKSKLEPAQIIREMRKSKAISIEDKNELLELANRAAFQAIKEWVRENIDDPKEAERIVKEMDEQSE